MTTITDPKQKYGASAPPEDVVGGSVPVAEAIPVYGDTPSSNATNPAYAPGASAAASPANGVYVPHGAAAASAAAAASTTISPGTPVAPTSSYITQAPPVTQNMTPPPISSHTTHVAPPQQSTTTTTHTTIPANNTTSPPPPPTTTGAAPVYGLTHNSTQMICPHCKEHMRTHVRGRVDWTTVLMVGPLFPFVFPCCKTTEHYCSKCHRKIGSAPPCSC